jgi:general secretion pathway protein H
MTSQAEAAATVSWLRSSPHYRCRAPSGLRNEYDAGTKRALVSIRSRNRRKPRYRNDANLGRGTPGRGLAVRGFTLLELIITLAILGLALVLITGYRPPWSTAFGLRGTAAELAAGLRLARSQAIAGNRQVAVDLDLAGHRYRVGDGPPQALPAALSIELLTVAGENRGRREGDIRFNPDGSSTGGRISLAEGHRRVAVGVDWLTGRVTVADVR